MVPNITAITAKTTRTFSSDSVIYFYKHVRPELFFGYNPITVEAGKYLLAEPEKAILDYLYFHQNQFETESDMEEWRVNSLELKESIDVAKLKKYLASFKSPKMEKAINILIKYANL